MYDLRPFVERLAFFKTRNSRRTLAVFVMGSTSLALLSELLL